VSSFNFGPSVVLRVVTVFEQIADGIDTCMIWSCRLFLDAMLTR
jgi:MFS superfamily sulfate permease-like transporter